VTKRRTRIALAAVFGGLLLAAGVLALLGTVYTDYLWFKHLGFGSVFTTVLLARAGTGLVFGLVALAALGAHILAIRRLSKPRADWSLPLASGETIDLKNVVRRVATPVVVAAAVLAATVMGYWASLHWEDVLRALHRTAFGTSDPVLGEDIGFYLFALPVMQFSQVWLLYLTGICLLLSAAVYLLRGAMAIEGRQLKMPDGVQAHIYLALSCVLGVIAWGWRLEMFEALFSKRGIAFGATYTDVHANLIAFPIMIGVCAVGALSMAWMAYRRPRGKRATHYPALVLAGVVLLYLVTTFVWPTAVQRLVVQPNELDKERPYLVHAIQGTRAAYGLDMVETRDFAVQTDLTASDLKRNGPTIENIKLWDARPLKLTYKQVQAIRLYYDFPTINVDRYPIDGRSRQVMLGAREMVPDLLPEKSRTWVNRHLQYTHGYGVCLNPVNRVGPEGLPELWIRDIPPQWQHPELAIRRPEIYYGRATTDHVIVQTTAGEFDFPQGQSNRYTRYEGNGGVGVGTFWRRLLLAIHLADVNLFFTGHLTGESKVLFHREIQERVSRVVPFLMLDKDPYLVVAKGRLYWIQDAYTVSYRYPYATPTPLGKRARINYIRNSVKVVVDAYHGDLKLYIWDERDPMVRTYAKMFPGLFTPGSQMPEVLREHVRYPKDLFTIQAETYASFHMTDPGVFYNQEDRWELSRELPGKGGEASASAGQGGSGTLAEPGQMAPHYMVMKLPLEKHEEFLLLLPYTPVGKSNMVAWIAARCDGERYGRLIVYTFPKNQLVYGPMQIEARIDQDEDISKWITLRDQMGSRVIRGELLVIPVEDSILYVEPVYLQAVKTQIPELKQVVVAFGARLAMRDTLDAALATVFGTEEGRPLQGPMPVADAPRAKDLLELARRALAHYRAAQKSRAIVDWDGYHVEQIGLKRSLDAISQALDARMKGRPQAGSHSLDRTSRRPDAR